MTYSEGPIAGNSNDENMPLENQPVTESAFVYPPKYVKKEQTANIWLRSLASLAAYLILGYYIFPSYKILLLITAIVMIHELGHFIAMKFYRYNELGIFFIPLLGAYVSGSKREVSQMQSAVILLAGPLPGIVIGTIMYLLAQTGQGYNFLDIGLERTGLLFIILNLINLFPVYPLDGGQLLNRVFWTTAQPGIFRRRKYMEQSICFLINRLSLLVCLEKQFPGSFCFPGSDAAPAFW